MIQEHVGITSSRLYLQSRELVGECISEARDDPLKMCL